MQFLSSFIHTRYLGDQESVYAIIVIVLGVVMLTVVVTSYVALMVALWRHMRHKVSFFSCFWFWFWLWVNFLEQEVFDYMRFLRCSKLYNLNIYTLNLGWGEWNSKSCNRNRSSMYVLYLGTTWAFKMKLSNVHKNITKINVIFK